MGLKEELQRQEAPAPLPAGHPRRRGRWRPRFSLKTLLLFVLSAFSALTLWLHWEPWVVQARLEEGDSSFIQFAAFSKDGRKVVSFERDGRSRVWDADSGTLLSSRLVSTETRNEIASGADGPVLIATGPDGYLPMEEPWLLDLRAKLNWPVTVEFTDTPLTEAVSFLNSIITKKIKWGTPGLLRIDPRALANGFGDKLITHTITDMDVLSAISCIANLAGLEVCLRDQSITLLEPRVMAEIRSAELQQSARIWDLETGRLLVVLRGHTAPLHSLALSHDARWALTGSADGSLRLWNAQSGDEIAKFKADLSGRFQSASISSAGNRFAALGTDGIVRIWKHESPSQPTELHQEKSALELSTFYLGGIVDVSLSMDGALIATREEMRPVKIWDAGTGSLLHAHECRTSSPSEHLQFAYFTPDSQRMVLLHGNDREALWDAHTGKPIHIDEASPILEGSYFVEFSPDGNRIVAMWGTRPYVFDAHRGITLAHLPFPESNPDVAAFKRAFQKIAGYFTDRFDDPGANPFLGGPGHSFAARFSLDGEKIVGNVYDELLVWRRRRPEWWWGVAWLPEFWIALVLTAALAWSVRRDFGDLRRKQMPEAGVTTPRPIHYIRGS